jgi:flagellar motor switch protein FliN
MTVAQEVELETLPEANPEGKPLVPTLLPLLGAVKVCVSVRVGVAEARVAELLALRDGSTLALDRLLHEPLDLMVGEQVVARGMLVAVGEHFGVRITEPAA